MRGVKYQFMKLQNIKRRNIQAYDRKSGNLEKRLEKDYIDHGIATIPCKISGFDDIISPYSVKGYESLNSEFVEYVNGIADLVPEEYPIVLSIVGQKFTREEQETIKSTIEDDFAYDLGSVEEENKYRRRVFIWMTVGLALSCILLAVLKWQESIQLELLFVVFWFCADVFVDYLLIEGWQLKKRRIRAARLACLKVEFSEEYDEEDYTEEEAEEIRNELYHET